MALRWIDANRRWLLVLTIGLSIVFAIAIGMLIVNRPPDQSRVFANQTPDTGLGISAQLKLDTVFLELLTTYRTQGQDAAVALGKERGVLTENNDVRMTLVLNTNDNSRVVAALAQYNINVEDAYRNRVSILVPFAVMTQGTGGQPFGFATALTSFSEVTAIEAPKPIVTGMD